MIPTDDVALSHVQHPRSQVLPVVCPETISKIKAMPFSCLPKSKPHLEDILDRMLDEKCCVVVKAFGQLLKSLRCH